MIQRVSMFTVIIKSRRGYWQITPESPVAAISWYIMYGKLSSSLMAASINIYIMAVINEITHVFHNWYK